MDVNGIALYIHHQFALRKLDCTCADMTLDCASVVGPDRTQTSGVDMCVHGVEKAYTDTDSAFSVLTDY